MKQRNVTEGCAGMGKEHTMPVIFMEEKIMLEAEYEKEREKIEGKEDDRLKNERIQTLQIIFQRAWRYQEQGMLEELVLGFVRKKTRMIEKAKTKGELQEISKPPNPVSNGNGFTAGKYDTEEEELLVWSLTSLKEVPNTEGCKRYGELFCRLLPEKAKILFPEMNENN
ncbi:hypothetical protein [Blautia sp. An81]|uniref:hypothetical protein n=1 Tax=Blautia sp. An81 TaxID=1965659 RepID=UPI000B36BFE3|nr:hypothetical protein [Blautia sp. An81]OUN31620.1 hypothetical protein B5G33_02795 [Blautia sp. An81]